MSKRLLPALLVLLGALCLLLLPGCVFLGGSKSWVCADGAPLKVLTDPACVRGVCGYTCAPDRWKTPPATPEPAPAPTPPPPKEPTR